MVCKTAQCQCFLLATGLKMDRFSSLAIPKDKHRNFEEIMWPDIKLLPSSAVAGGREKQRNTETDFPVIDQTRGQTTWTRFGHKPDQEVIRRSQRKQGNIFPLLGSIGWTVASQTKNHLILRSARWAS